jgi:hypothetical protein
MGTDGAAAADVTDGWAGDSGATSMDAGAESSPEAGVDAGFTDGSSDALATGDGSPPLSYAVTDLGALPMTTACTATGVNDSAEVAGTCDDSRPYFWSAGTMTEIVLPSSVSPRSGHAHRINANGQVAGGGGTAGGSGWAFRWDMAGGLTLLRGACSGTCPSPNSGALSGAEAWAIDDSGSVGGHAPNWTSTDGGTRPTIWTWTGSMPVAAFFGQDNSNMAVQGLGAGGWACGVGMGVSAGGQNYGQGWVFDGAAVTPLGSLVGSQGTSTCNDMNDAHQLVGRADGNPGGAILWQNGTMTLLPGGGNTTATAINARGDVVGVEASGGGPTAVFWPAGGGTKIYLDQQSLTPAGWKFTSAEDISDGNGYIVGTGYPPGTGAQHGYLLKLM